jgi:hypothetical protein
MNGRKYAFVIPMAKHFIRAYLLFCVALVVPIIIKVKIFTTFLSI